MAVESRVGLSVQFSMMLVPSFGLHLHIYTVYRSPLHTYNTQNEHPIQPTYDQGTSLLKATLARHQNAGVRHVDQVSRQRIDGYTASRCRSRARERFFIKSEIQSKKREMRFVGRYGRRAFVKYQGVHCINGAVISVGVKSVHTHTHTLYENNG